MFLIWEGKKVADQVEIAASFPARLKGLLGRKHMPPGSALIIKPCNSIHTWFMRFNIDVLFLDACGYILRVVHNMPPFRMIRVRGAVIAVEIPAGTAGKLGVKAGTRLEVVHDC